MESMEMPTQMTVNTPTSIGGDLSQDSSFEHSKMESNDKETNVKVVENEVSHESSIIVPPEIIKNKSTADKLLESAKEDGFEDALQKFIDGEFETDEKGQSQEVVEEIQNEKKEHGLTDSNETIEGETIEEETPVFDIGEKIKMLEDHIETLQVENKELLERAKLAERTNSANQEIMLALAKALYELAKKEENEEQKVNMLEIIVKMLTMFMQEIMTDAPVGESSKQEEKPSEVQRKSSKKSDAVAELINVMEKRNGKVIDMESKRPQPPASNIEMPAA